VYFCPHQSGEKRHRTSSSTTKERGKNPIGKIQNPGEKGGNKGRVWTWTEAGRVSGERRGERACGAPNEKGIVRKNPGEKDPHGSKKKGS